MDAFEVFLTLFKYDHFSTNQKCPDASAIAIGQPSSGNKKGT